MFREMRRKKQALSQEAIDAVLARCTSGTLACLGDEGYPYSVPLSFAHDKNKIYFHSARSGHKMDAITKYPKVSFSVIDEDTIVSQEYTTYFRSVIAFGQARIAEGEEWLEGFRALVEKYSKDQPEAAKAKEIDQCTKACIFVIDIQHITGKEAIELVGKKNQDNPHKSPQ